MVRNIPHDIRAEIKDAVRLVVQIQEHRAVGCTRFEKADDGMFYCKECGDQLVHFQSNEEDDEEL